MFLVVNPSSSRILVNVLSAVNESLNWQSYDDDRFHHDVKIQFVNLLAIVASIQNTNRYGIKHNYLIEENTRDHDELSDSKKKSIITSIS